jgi:hypothetical protein
MTSAAKLTANVDGWTSDGSIAGQRSCMCFVVLAHRTFIRVLLLDGALFARWLLAEFCSGHVSCGTQETAHVP